MDKLISDDQPSGLCPHHSTISCGNCQLGDLCLPLSLNSSDIVQLDKIVERGRPLQRGDHLFRENDRFVSVFAVRSGAVKAYHLTDDGQEQVTGFFFPGEILGMDGISKDKHVNSAKALETTAICEIPFDRLGELSTKLPSLQRHFFQLMSQEIAADQQLITMLSKRTAEERLAFLLLSISARYSRRGLSSTHFRLSMSRTDIANFLGLTVETVSRLFTRFQKNDTIAVDQKEIRLLDTQRLTEIANISRQTT